jgi:glyoxylase-like metal-dependent hydrolase (beta-lactamase superfamily II)
MRITEAILAAAAVAVAACNSLNPELALGPASAIALTGGPNTSLVYVARTDSGVIAIDLGWWGHERAISRALERLGARPTDVKQVFLTHTHRDHIAAWSMVRQARFHLAAAEYPLFVGQASHRGWMVRLAEGINGTSLPKPDELDVQTYSRDTAYVIGRDTLRAFIVPGHTAGSAAYLFRGVLFIGDAATHSMFRGFRPAKAQFSDDPALAAENLAALASRLPPTGIRVICTSHAECALWRPGHTAWMSLSRAQRGK